jgi:hypothetical protein
MYKAVEYTCQKINWAQLTMATVAQNLSHDTPLELRRTRSSYLLLFCLWQSYVLPFATQHLRYLTTQTQVQQLVQIVQSDKSPDRWTNFTAANREPIWPDIGSRFAPVKLVHWPGDLS